MALPLLQPATGEGICRFGELLEARQRLQLMDQIFLLGVDRSIDRLCFWDLEDRQYNQQAAQLCPSKVVSESNPTLLDRFILVIYFFSLRPWWVTHNLFLHFGDAGRPLSSQLPNIWLKMMGGKEMF